jgi:hypothetical protein
VSEMDCDPTINKLPFALEAGDCAVEFPAQQTSVSKKNDLIVECSAVWESGYLRIARHVDVVCCSAPR